MARLFEMLLLQLSSGVYDDIIVHVLPLVPPHATCFHLGLIPLLREGDPRVPTACAYRSKYIRAVASMPFSHHVNIYLISQFVSLESCPNVPLSRGLYHGIEQNVLTDGKDEEHLSKGVYDTYTNTSLRYKIMSRRGALKLVGRSRIVWFFILQNAAKPIFCYMGVQGALFVKGV